VSLLVYCDGSGQGLAGLPGGWAFAVLREGVLLESGAGGAKKTTSNHMELTAALEGLRCALAHREGAEPILLVTDSRLTIDVAEGRDLPARLELPAAALCELFRGAQASARWVRGHSGEAWNEHVDAAARAARLTFTSAKARRRLLARR
jgi:ribonuclease HI